MLRIVGCELASEGRPTSASGSKAALMARRPIYPPRSGLKSDIVGTSEMGPTSDITRSPHRRGRAASLAFPGRALSRS